MAVEICFREGVSVVRTPGAVVETDVTVDEETGDITVALPAGLTARTRNLITRYCRGMAVAFEARSSRNVPVLGKIRA